MPFIFLIIGAVCCSLATFFAPSTPAPSPVVWYGRIHIGWLGMAFYLWNLVALHH